MLLVLFTAIIMMTLTTFIHAAAMVAVISFTQREQGSRRHHLQSKMFRVGGIVVFMFCVSLVESVLWAVPYMIKGMILNFSDAVYFSMVTYTTLGYGDIVVADGVWRLLASFEAAVGIIMFGWTTAIVMSVIRHIYFGESR